VSILVDETRGVGTALLQCCFGLATVPAVVTNRTHFTCVSPPANATVAPNSTEESGPVAIAVNFGGNDTEVFAWQASDQLFTYYELHTDPPQPGFGAHTGGTQLDVAISLSGWPNQTLPSALCLFTSPQGAATALGMYSDNGSNILCETPPVLGFMVATVDVSLNGQQYTADAHSFAYVPTVSASSSHIGPATGGTLVHVYGSGFTSSGTTNALCRFDFGGENATVVTAQVLTASVMLCLAPPAVLFNQATIAQAAVAVSVDHGDHFVSVPNHIFWYYTQAPIGLEEFHIGSVPVTGGVNLTTRAVISHSLPGAQYFCGFSRAGNASVFASSQLLISGENTTIASCVIPASEAAMQAEVQVSLNGEQFFNTGVHFFYYNPSLPPALTTMDPGTGPRVGGTAVILTGQNMANKSALVCRFNGTAMRIANFLSDTSVSCVSPSRFDASGVTQIPSSTSVEVSNDMVLWSNQLVFDYTETVSLMSSAFWTGVLQASEPAVQQLMGADFDLDVQAGHVLTFLVQARDENRIDNPFGSDFFVATASQTCDVEVPGRRCRWSALPETTTATSTDLDPQYNSELTLDDAAPGRHTLSWNVTVSGDYQLAMTLDGAVIEHSPWTIRVHPFEPTASETLVFGAGTVSAQAGYTSAFTIQPRDMYGNNCSFAADPTGFCVRISGHGITEVEICSACPSSADVGRWLRRIVPTAPSAQCPFAAANFSFCSDSCVLDQRCDWQADCVSPGLPTAAHSPTCEQHNGGSVCTQSDGALSVQWHSTRSSIASIEVMRGLMHVPGSPFVVDIQPGHANATMCNVSGNLTNPSFAGFARSVLVAPVDTFGNLIAEVGGLTISWRLETTAGAAIQFGQARPTESGRFNISFIPTGQTGQYQLSARLTSAVYPQPGKMIGAAPWSFQLTNGDQLSEEDCAASADCVTYSWVASSFMPCATACDTEAVQQIRSVSCVGSDGLDAAENSCLEAKPESSRLCAATVSCVAWTWFAPLYPSCPISCGLSTTNQSRSVLCMGSDGVQATAANCAGPKNSTSRLCPATESCVSYDWFAPDFPVCPTACGVVASNQSREVRCIGSNGMDAESDSSCTDLMPNETRHCAAATDECEDVAYSWYAPQYPFCLAWAVTA
jgi:hypothetical protein